MLIKWGVESWNHAPKSAPIQWFSGSLGDIFRRRSGRSVGAETGWRIDNRFKNRDLQIFSEIENNLARQVLFIPVPNPGSSLFCQCDPNRPLILFDSARALRKIPLLSQTDPV